MDAPPDTPDGDRLDALASLIESCEARHWPRSRLSPPPSPPIDPHGRSRALEGAPGDAMQALDAALEINRCIRVAASALPQAAVTGPNEASWLLESLYDHVEAAVLLDPMLDLERRTSAWWFERWTPAPARQRPDETFPRGVREQEWSLVERSTLRLEAPVVAGYSDGSFAGVFTVHDRRESEITLEDVAGGHRYLVHEHNGEIAYHPEYLALGRLIPFGPGRYLLLTRDGVPGVARSGARSRARQTARTVGGRAGACHRGRELHLHVPRRKGAA
jgi:hypothetical protein